MRYTYGTMDGEEGDWYGMAGGSAEVDRTYDKVHRYMGSWGKSVTEGVVIIVSDEPTSS